MVRQMKDSGVEWIGEIPEKWEMCRIKDYFLVKNGATPNSGNGDYWNGDITWITPSDYKTNDVYIDNSSRTITQEGYDSCGTNMVPIDSIIISNRAPIGSVGIAKISLCTSQGCKSLVKRNEIESKFVYYYLSISSSELNILGRGTTFLELSSYDLGMFDLTIPNVNEQQKIVEFLDEKVGEIDSVIARTKETIEDYKKYKQAIITDAVTKGLNPDVEMKESGIEWLGNIPVHWDKIVLKKVSTKPISYGVIKLFDPDENGVKILRCSDIKDGYIIEDAIRTITKELSNEYSRTILQSGDVVINVRGTLGGCAVVPESMNGYNIAREVALIAIDKEKYFSNYIMYCLLSKTFENFRDYSLSGCIYLGINMETLSKFMCPLPSLKEQREIAEYLDEECSEIDNLIAKKEELLADLEDYKKSLIYEYVTGKKEVG